MGHRISKYQQRTPAAITTSSVQTSAAAAAAEIENEPTTSSETLCTHIENTTTNTTTASTTIPSATKIKQQKRKKGTVTKQRKQQTHASPSVQTVHALPSPFSIQTTTTTSTTTTATSSDRLFHLSNSIQNDRIASTKPTIEVNLINNLIGKQQQQQHLSTSSIRTAALVHQQQFESLTSTGNSVVITIRMLKMESNDLNSLVQQHQQQQWQQHENCISESSIVISKYNKNNINNNNSNLNINHNTINDGSKHNNFNNQSNLNNNYNQVMDNKCSNGSDGSDVTSPLTTEFDICENPIKRIEVAASKCELLNNCCSINSTRNINTNNNNKNHNNTNSANINQNSNENAIILNENNKLMASMTSVNNSNNNIIAIATNLDNHMRIVDSNDLRIVEDEIALNLPSKHQHNFICDNSINNKQDDNASPSSMDWSVQSTSSMAMINAMTNKLNQANITATTSAALIDGIPAEIINSVSPYPHHIPIGNIHHHDCTTIECKFISSSSSS